MIIAIFAVDSNNGISKNGALPWPFSTEDMNWFKTQTTNNVVVMGRTTWDAPDMPSPLPRRVNVVFTTRGDIGGCEVRSGDVQATLVELQNQYPDKNIFVIGGAKLLGQATDVLDCAYITRIQGTFNCDTFISLENIVKGMQLTEQRPLGDAILEIYKRLQ